MFRNADFFVREAILNLRPSWPIAGLTAIEVRQRASIGSSVHRIAGKVDVDVREPDTVVLGIVRSLVAEQVIEPVPNDATRYRVVPPPQPAITRERRGRSFLLRGR